MDVHDTICRTTPILTVEQRVELILDLTRRLDLLDHLLSAARERRRATDSETQCDPVDTDDIAAWLAL
jgi:predicted DNA-binding protein YlxM (UPF0122 family)